MDVLWLVCCALLLCFRYLNETSNAENVELYAVWPYRLYTLGQDGYETIMNNYRLRLFPCNEVTARSIHSAHCSSRPIWY
jgi:hypothetical protein